MYAEALDATYAGLAREEFDALRGAARELSERVGLTDAKVVAALPSLRLPYFEKMRPETLVEVRSNESAFDDFRKILREVLKGCLQARSPHSLIAKCDALKKTH